MAPIEMSLLGLHTDRALDREWMYVYDDNDDAGPSEVDESGQVEIREETL